MGKCYISDEIWLICSKSRFLKRKLTSTSTPNISMHAGIAATEADNQREVNIPDFEFCDEVGTGCMEISKRYEWTNLPETNVTFGGHRPLGSNSVCVCYPFERSSPGGELKVFIGEASADNYISENKPSTSEQVFGIAAMLGTVFGGPLLLEGGLAVDGIVTLYTGAKTAVGYVAGLGSVVWNADGLADKAYSALYYIGADPSFAGDVWDFIDNAAGVVYNFTNPKAWISLGLATVDLIPYSGDLKPNGRVYKSDTDGEGGLTPDDYWRTRKKKVKAEKKLKPEMSMEEHRKRYNMENIPEEYKGTKIFTRGGQEHTNKTYGHWETIVDTARKNAGLDGVTEIHLDRRIKDIVPGSNIKERPDVTILKNEKIYIYEVPSATDSIRKLNEKMEKQCTQLGDKCGGFGIIHIKGE